MPDTAPPPASPPSSAPAKKGLSPIAWILLIIGVIGTVAVAGCFVVGVWVFRAGQEAVQEVTGDTSLGSFLEDLRKNPTRVGAEAVIRANPDLDLVATDEAAGTVTFRDNRTGEESTLNFEDIAEGRFSVTTADGEISIDGSEAATGGGVTLTGPEGTTRLGATVDLSDVPDWVRLYPGATETQSTFQTTSAGSVSGALSGTTTDSAQVVIDYFAAELENAGYTIMSQSMTRTPDGALGAIAAELEAEAHSTNVTAIEQDGETQVMVNYEKRP